MPTELRPTKQASAAGESGADATGSSAAGRTRPWIAGAGWDGRFGRVNLTHPIARPEPSRTA